MGGEAKFKTLGKKSKGANKMSKKPIILVTSATGRTGIPTVLQLLEKGFPVRAFVRKSSYRYGVRS